MSVRKRTWKTSKGEERTAWIVDYTDQEGDRHIETFAKKKDADARHAEVGVGVRAGTHIAPSKSITVKEAGEDWIDGAETAGLERSTLAQYRQHLNLHIAPFMGKTKLSDVTPQVVRKLEDRLRAEGRSPAMIRKVLTSLGSLLADAQEQGKAARNAVRELRHNRKRGKEHKADKRKRRKLEIGKNIPTVEEARAIMAHAEGRWRPLLVTAISTGLRASELRGLHWSDVDLKQGEIHVRRRADRYNKTGYPKSDAGHRTVPFGPSVVSILKAWKLACPPSDLVFPNGNGNVENLGNLINRGLKPAQVAAGVTVPVLDAKGKATFDDKGVPIVAAKYTGMHALRHFYASWLINPKDRGGQNLPPKVVQERMGHSSITLTYDLYGHLFPRGDDSAELAAAESALLG
jgi:integrase